MGVKAGWCGVHSSWGGKPLNQFWLQTSPSTRRKEIAKIWTNSLVQRVVCCAEEVNAKESKASVRKGGFTRGFWLDGNSSDICNMYEHLYSVHRWSDNSSLSFLSATMLECENKCFYITSPQPLHLNGLCQRDLGGWKGNGWTDVWIWDFIWFDFFLMFRCLNQIFHLIWVSFNVQMNLFKC